MATQYGGSAGAWQDMANTNTFGNMSAMATGQGNAYNPGGYVAPNLGPSALPFQSSAGGIPFGGNPAQLSADYAQRYNNALAINAANYSNINKGYENALTRMNQEQYNRQINYFNLQNDISNQLGLAGSTRRQELADQYAALSGQQSQDLINRGLGNSTIQASVNRGLALDQAKAVNQVNEQVAGLKAQYGTQLGLARIGDMQAATNEYAGLTGQRLGWMNSVNAPYPDAGLYANLASQYAQAQQLNRLAAGGGFGGAPAQLPGGQSGSLGPTGLNRPPPGMFAPNAGAYMGGAPTGYGFNPALAAPAGPYGYSGAGSIPVLGEEAAAGGNALGAVTGMPILEGEAAGLNAWGEMFG